MPYGGILTNRRFLVSKLKQTTYGFYNVSKINKTVQKKILYSERMVYNSFFKKNYYNNYQLPHCLIIFDLNSYILYEAMTLKIPILGLVNHMDFINGLTFPLLFNNNSLFSLFLLLTLLHNFFLFSIYLENFNYKFNLIDIFSVKSKINKKININKLIIKKKKLKLTNLNYVS
jgi:ribosomal protein S2